MSCSNDYFISRNEEQLWNLLPYLHSCLIGPIILSKIVDEDCSLIIIRNSRHLVSPFLLGLSIGKILFIAHRCHQRFQIVQDISESSYNSRLNVTLSTQVYLHIFWVLNQDGENDEFDNPNTLRPRQRTNVRDNNFPCIVWISDPPIEKDWSGIKVSHWSYIGRYRSLPENNIRELTSLRSNKGTILFQWVSKSKTNEKGKIVKFKARLNIK